MGGLPKRFAAFFVVSKRKARVLLGCPFPTKCHVFKDQVPSRVLVKLLSPRGISFPRSFFVAGHRNERAAASPVRGDGVITAIPPFDRNKRRVG